MTLDQLLEDLGLSLTRDTSGQVNSGTPPTPLPPVGTYYAVTQTTPGTVRTQLHGGAQDRVRFVLVSVYGAPDTAAGRRQLDIVMAHLRTRAKEIDRHPGIRVRECRPADENLDQRDATTGTRYASIRLALDFLSP